MIDPLPLPISKQLSLSTLLEHHPRLLTPLHKAGISLDRHQPVSEQSLSHYLSEPELTTLLATLNHQIEKNRQDDATFSQLREQLLKAGSVNLAGFSDFTWHNRFCDELTQFAQQEQIPLNLQLFIKGNKEKFQHYLLRAHSGDDLPDLLIGKGFSSLTSRDFIHRFVKQGVFDQAPTLQTAPLCPPWPLSDPLDQYHAFGAQELVVLQDMSKKTANQPQSWSDLLRPEYKGELTLMGKPQQNHFGFSMLFYLSEQLGDEGIRRFAANVKARRHFSTIIRDLGKNHPDATPFNIVQRSTTGFIRHDAHYRILTLSDGNPVTPLFCLIKKGSSEAVHRIARHLLSTQIAAILTQAGAISAANETKPSIRWIGWDTLRNRDLPLLKEQLSLIAHDSFTECQP